MPEILTPEVPVQSPVQTPDAQPPAPRKVPKKGAKKKLFKRIIAIVITLAILAGIGFGMWFLVFREEKAEQTIYFEYASIGSIQSTVQGSGNASAKETATVTIPANGTVMELLVSNGDMVYAGQPLYTISSPLAEEAVYNAVNAVNAAQDSIASLNKDLNELYAERQQLTVTAPYSGKLQDVVDLRPGDYVGANSPVATLVNDRKFRISLYFSYIYEDQIYVGQGAEVSIPSTMYYTSGGVVEEIHKVSYITPEGGVYFEAVIVFDNPGTLTAGLNATAVLYGSDGAPIYPYDGGQIQYYETRSVTARVSGPVMRADMRNYANVEAGQTLLVLGADDQDSRIRAKQEEIQAAVERLDAAQETLAKAQEALTALSASAPIDGTIISCTIAEGSEVNAGDAVITITNTNTMVVNIQVDDRNIGFIQLGMPIDLNDWNGNYYMGIVTDIAFQGQVGSGMSTFPVTLEVENWGGTLYSGAWLDYSFVTSQSDAAVLVPTTSVKSVIDSEGERRTVVFVYREEAPAEAIELDPSITGVPTPQEGYYPIPVETGISDTSSVEILSGVNDGDRVFINYTAVSGGGSYGMY